MKKIISILAVAICCVSLFAACGSKTSPITVELKEGQSVNSIVEQISTDIGIAMPSEVDAQVLTDICYIPADAVDTYAGQITMVNVSADNVIAVKAKDGKIDVVKTGLEKRLVDVQKSFEQYLPDQYEKAKKGQVIVKGNYAFLLVLGESMETYDADIEAAKKIIDSAFV